MEDKPPAKLKQKNLTSFFGKVTEQATASVHVPIVLTKHGPRLPDRKTKAAITRKNQERARAIQRKATAEKYKCEKQPKQTIKKRMCSNCLVELSCMFCCVCGCKLVLLLLLLF